MKAPETVVTQEDRDAAADAVKAYRGQKNGDWQARVRRGEADDGEMVQAFARHREQSITALQAELASARKVACEVVEAQGLALGSLIDLIGDTDHGEGVRGKPYAWTRAPTTEETQAAMEANNAARDWLTGVAP